MINVGVLGKGDFSRKKLEKINAFPSFNFIGAYDSFSWLENFANPISLLNQSDALFIFDTEISDYQTLKELTRKLKHLYVHDPSRLSYDQCQQLQSLAFEAGTVIQFGYSPLYSETFETLSDEHFEAPMVEIQHTLKYGNQGATLSLLNDLLLQDIEMACYFAKSEIKNVRANGIGNIEDNPDQIHSRLEFFNGCVVNLNISKMGVENRHISTLFHGNSQQVIDHLENTISFFEENELEEINKTRNFHQVRKVELSDQYNFDKGLGDFLQCVELEKKPKSSLDSFINVKFIASFIVDQVSSNFAKV